MKRAPVALLACSLIALAGCGSEDTASPSASSSATPSSAKGDSAATPDACKLLTPAEVGAVTGWKQPTARPVDTTASYVSSCHFTNGESLASVLMISVSVGGATHANSAEYAKSVSDSTMTYSVPATPVDGFPVPVIDIDYGAMHARQARTAEAIELSVMSESAEHARALFPEALARLPGG